MKGQRCRPRRTPLPLRIITGRPSLSRPPGELQGRGWGRAGGWDCSLGAKGRAKADRPATGAPPAGEWRTAGGPRHLEEREGRARCPAIPEGGREDSCLGASCTDARTLAAAERRMGAYAPPAGRLGDEAQGLGSAEVEPSPG